MLGSSLASSGWAQRKSTQKRTFTAVVTMQTQAAGTVSVSLAPVPDGALVTSGASGQRVLDLGTVSRGSRLQNPNVQVRQLPDRLVVSTKIGLTIQDSGQRFSSATVLACLAFPDAARVLSLDGIRLNTVPQIVQGKAALGRLLAHRLEIEVPASLTEKNAELHNAIIFQVVPN